MRVLGHGERGCVVQEDDAHNVVTKVIVRKHEYEAEMANATLLKRAEKNAGGWDYIIYPDPDTFEEVPVTKANAKFALDVCTSLQATYNHFREPNIYFARMKYGGVSVQTLQNKIQPTQKLTFQEACTILQQILYGVESLHSASLEERTRKANTPSKTSNRYLVHGDLHASNVTIDGISSGQPGARQLHAYIIDFSEGITDGNSARDVEYFHDFIWKTVSAITNEEGQEKLAKMHAYLSKPENHFKKSKVAGLLANFDDAITYANEQTLRTRGKSRRTIAFVSPPVSPSPIQSRSKSRSRGPFDSPSQSRKSRFYDDVAPTKLFDNIDSP